MQTRHEQELIAAADEYRRASEAKDAASARLADAMRAAYNDGEQQSAILRAAGHVWTREYLRVILGLTKRPAK